MLVRSKLGFFFSKEGEKSWRDSECERVAFPRRTKVCSMVSYLVLEGKAECTVTKGDRNDLAGEKVFENG